MHSMEGAQVDPEPRIHPYTSDTAHRPQRPCLVSHRSDQSHSGRLGCAAAGESALARGIAGVLDLRSLDS
jgi:hypothetical protein